MKRILLVCCLLAASFTPAFIQHATAQVTAPTPTPVADFTAKVNLMDSQIGAGDITAATATWNQVHQMMINTLAVTKHSIYSAATPADKTTYTNIMLNQRTIYDQIWNLHTGLATNRAALHSQLGTFGATIY